MKLRHLAAILSIIYSNETRAQFTTPTIDGNLDGAGIYPHNYVTDGRTWYVTWDNTNLYVFVDGAGGGNRVLMYFDTNISAVVNGGATGSTSGINYSNTNLVQLPFSAEAFVAVENFYRQLNTCFTGTTFGGAQNVTAASGWAFASGDFTNDFEIQIPWDALTNGSGRPTSFNWFGYITDNNIGGNYFSELPLENPNGILGQTLPNATNTSGYERYFTVSSTADGASTSPISQNSYTFVKQAGVDDNFFGSIAVYDFTMNTAGRQIARTGASAWSIAGRLTINAGTVFCGSSGPFTQATNISELSISGGTFSIDASDDFVNVSGNVTVEAGGTLSLSVVVGGDLRIGGQFTMNGTLNPNSRAIFFNGSGSQSISGAAAIPSAFLIVDKPTNDTLVLNQSLVIGNGSDEAVVQIVSGKLRLNNQSLSASGAGSKALRIHSGGTLITDGTSLTAFTLFRNTSGASGDLDGTVAYNGSGAETVVGATLASYNVLQIGGSGVKTLSESAPLSISDSLYLDGATFNILAPDNLAPATPVIFSGGTLTPLPDTLEAVTLEEGAATLPAFVVGLKVNGAAIIPNSMTAGEINLNAKATLQSGVILETLSSPVGGSVSQYIITQGSSALRRSITGEQTAEFPVGTPSNYFPVSITALSGVIGGQISVSVDGSNPATGRAGDGNFAIQNVYKIDAPSFDFNGGAASVTFGWESATEGVDFIDTLSFPARWTGANWQSFRTEPSLTRDVSVKPRTVSISDVTAFSEWAVFSGIDDSPLPVSLISFSANSTPNGAELVWKTASEIDNLGFMISRTMIEKGKPQKNWETIASYQQIQTLKGRGTTLSESSYAYLDRTVETGKEYAYKLQSVDLNGAVHYYDLIAFASGKPLSYRLEQNYPNPFNPNTVIRYQLPEASAVKLEIFDVIGKKAGTIVNAKQAAGEYIQTFRASEFSLSSGVYFYRLEAGSFIETKKMIFVK